MAKKTHGLGRGLDVLLPDMSDAESGIREIGIGDIDPNPDQPRRTFTEESIRQLADSIREMGLLQPVLVTQNGSRYRLVAGERRWRAARLAGLTTIACIVRDMDRKQEMEAALIENLQREDLNPVESAQGIRSLMNEYGYTQEEVAARLAKSRPAVANLLRILTLPEAVLDLVRDERLSMGHARALAGLERNPEAQTALARLAVEEGWSVRRLEEAVAAQKTRKPAKPVRRGEISAELRQLEDNMRERLGVRTTITGNTNRGRIVLQYSSAAELEAVWDAVERLRNA